MNGIVRKGDFEMENKTRIRKMRRRIENLRNKMVLAFVQNGADMSHPQVLRLSQLLDEQLNRYERCKVYEQSEPPRTGKLMVFAAVHHFG
ncbi:aspartyl-phosphate phosphatase Spo0E family protein [Cohnella cholangitidis]|uniref:Aspartyl-phosphate phosphatase Spo0E family protein n=2 Tax=Cohnella cholangitidis TaxID=2598458 RepID=A0A7G5BVA6_9BACL|nr:aspartyl-phosphate phosphatase Spo0E family protein [Cohnella cholangitidis]